MFEKEAEEIANKKLCSKLICYNHCNFSSPKHHRCGQWHRCYESAKDGAEFGYNKAIEKVKNCANCKHFNTDFIPYWCNKNNEYRNCWEKCGEWEMKE